MGADATDIGKTIHPHPTTSESVGMAAELFEGVCTDLPPQRKKMTQDELKELVAREALKHVVEDAIVGVGSGSTVFKFIDALATIKGRIEGAVAASEASAERLKKHGIRVFDLNSVNELPVYIDGADEITEHLHMIKGGGGALTREKITAAVAKQVRLHLRRLQAGAGARQVSAAGRGDPDGAQLRRRASCSRWAASRGCARASPPTTAT